MFCGGKLRIFGALWWEGGDFMVLCGGKVVSFGALWWEGGEFW